VIRWGKIEEDKEGEDKGLQLQAGILQGVNLTADAAEGQTEGRDQRGLSSTHQQQQPIRRE
jgi:hypothetical protein